MNIKILLSLFLFFSIQSYAQNTTLNHVTINSLIPSEYTLAFEYINYRAEASSEIEKFDTINSSVIEFDFNKDGLKDLAIIVEKPICYNKLTDGSCGNDLWDWGASDRTLMIFFASKNNGYELFLETKTGMLNHGEGGVASPDPLESFTVNAKGSIEISYWGGSSTKWAHSFKYQYRTVGSVSDFYVVGITNMYQDWAINSNGEPDGMMEYITDRNLITGDIIETQYLFSAEEDEQQQTVKKSKIKSNLIKLRNASDDFLFGYSI